MKPAALRSCATLAVALLLPAGAYAADGARTAPTRPQPAAAQPAPAPPPATKKVASAPAAAKSSPAKAAPPAAAKGYVGAKEMARILRLAPSWDARTKLLTLTGKGTKVVLELDHREAEVNGLRVFLGAATDWRGGELAVSRIDFQQLLTPMLRPGFGVSPPPPLRTIMLDPGHGGRDTGKINEKLRLLEKDMTLDTTRRVKALLEAQGYKVLLTRNDDRFVELADRPELANRADADLFVSIHFNAVEADTSRVTGIEVYTMTPQHQLSTAGGTDEFVPVFNPGNANDHWNVALGYALHRDLVRSLNASDRGFKRARFVVLRLARCPAALIEAGFLSSDVEARKIGTPAYRQQIATSIAAGIRSYAQTLTAVRGAAGTTPRAARN